LENAKKNGVTKAEIVAIITHNSFYAGWAKAWATFNLAKEVWYEDTKTETELDKYAKTIMFPIGNKNDAYKQYFIGQSYIAPISTEQVRMFNVTFEPKCRNNWHIHNAKKGGGQILIVVGGRGYYQEWNKAPQELKVGDVVNIPANTKHWHGAAFDSYFSHVAVEVDGEEISNTWLESVTDEFYNTLK
jgi:quercetin dioxygenase-like cupin family protein